MNGITGLRIKGNGVLGISEEVIQFGRSNQLAIID
jgi:hypothetical protein